MNKLRREIAYVTKLSSDGYGLPMMIWGLIGLFPPLWGFVLAPILASLGAAKRPIDTACLVTLAVLIAVAIYLTLRSLKFYRQSYGRVRLERRERVRTELKYWVYMLPVVFAFTLGIWVDKSFQPAISLSLVWLAFFAFVFWFAKGRGISSHQLWIGMVVLLLSLFPLSGLAARGGVYGFTLLEYASVLTGVLGFIVAAEGLLDHLILTRTLRALPQEDDDYEFV